MCRRARELENTSQAQRKDDLARHLEQAQAQVYLIHEKALYKGFKLPFFEELSKIKQTI